MAAVAPFTHADRDAHRMSNLVSLHVSLPLHSLRHRQFALMHAETWAATAVQQSPGQEYRSRNEYASTMDALVSFVDHLCRTTRAAPEHAFAPSAAKQHIAFIPNRYYEQMPSFIQLAGQLSEAHTYDEHVSLFRQACADLGLLQRDPPGNAKSDVHSLALRANIPETVFDALCARIAGQCQTATVQGIIAQRRHETRQRFLAYGDYIAAWLLARQRLVIIQLDLGYASDPLHPISLQLAEHDLQRFLRNRHHNQAFRGWVGYVAKLTCNMSEGPVWRLLLLFDGGARDGYVHIHIAESLGQHWQGVIAPNRGRFRNGNAGSAYGLGAASNVLGPLNHNDRRALVRLVNSYLFDLIMPLQFMRPKVDKRIRILRRGRIPPRDPNGPHMPRKR